MWYIVMRGRKMCANANVTRRNEKENRQGQLSCELTWQNQLKSKDPSHKYED